MARDQTIWFAMVDGREAGPMTRGEFALRMSTDLIDEETFVWKEGMSEWLPAAKVGDLAPLFKARVQARQRNLRPPPPPAAALAKARRAPPAEEEEEIELDLAPPTPPPSVEEEIELDVAAPTPPPPAEPVTPAPPARDRLREAAPISTIVEMLPLGELIHQQQVAKSLFTSGEIPSVSTGKTGKFALDDLKWAYAPTKKAPSPQDSKAAALARAIEATKVRPAEPVVHPVTPAYPRTPPAGTRSPVRARPSPKRARGGMQIGMPRIGVLTVGFGAGLAVVLVSALVIWLLR